MLAKNFDNVGHGQQLQLRVITLEWERRKGDGKGGVSLEQVQLIIQIWQTERIREFAFSIRPQSAGVKLWLSVMASTQLGRPLPTFPISLFLTYVLRWPSGGQPLTAAVNWHTAEQTWPMRHLRHLQQKQQLEQEQLCHTHTYTHKLNWRGALRKPQHKSLMPIRPHMRLWLSHYGLLREKCAEKENYTNSDAILERIKD